MLPGADGGHRGVLLHYEQHYDKLLCAFRGELGDLNRAVLISTAVVAYHEVKSRELFPYPDVPCLDPETEGSCSV